MRKPILFFPYCRTKETKTAAIDAYWLSDHSSPEGFDLSMVTHPVYTHI
jgi:hypothetical protein